MPLSSPHLLGTAHMPRADIDAVLALAARYAESNRSPRRTHDVLAGKTVVNMFFENSTRTRTSFEIAAKRLGAHVVNFAAHASSVVKGETFSDTVRVIDAMQVDALVIRHQDNGAAALAASLTKTPVLNAGDGANEHPTQALLDALTMIRHKGTLSGLNVAICGDIEHSRVARSNIHLLKTCGANIRLFAPPFFAPRDLKALGVPCFDRLEAAIEDCEVVMALRIQNERLMAGEMHMTGAEYHALYGLTHARLRAAKSGVIVMHPAPMNRGVEIASELADDPLHSVIFEQMEMGVAVRMACLHLLAGE